MNQLAIDFTAAKARRDSGMSSSLTHADDVEAGWSDHAYGLLVRYAGEQSHPFTIEGFRWWAASHGLADPPDSRAFGGVTQRAIRRSVIVRVGYAPAASSNGSPKPIYARPALDLAA